MNGKLRKIGLLGGDLRQIRLAELLSEGALTGNGTEGETTEGAVYETAVWGFRHLMDDRKVKEALSKCVRCADWESTVRASDLVILPLPVSADGIRLNCPFGPADCDVRLTEIMEACGKDTVVFGGRIPPIVKRLGTERGLTVFDYYESEALQIRNAVPTAEGAIAIAINELPVTVQGCRALITGYGRVARALAQRMILLGASVTVAARSSKDLACAESDGCIPIRLEQYRTSPVASDIIFNTVPAVIFDRDVLGKLQKETVMVELASGAGGVEQGSAGDIRLIQAPGLPGKLSSRTAGEIICRAVKEIFDEYYVK